MATEPFLSHRVDRLEEALIKLAEAQAETQRELADFKNEMLDFKNEKADLKERRPKPNNEIYDFKNELRESNRQMNMQWAKIADKMGTIVEDIIYPATRPLIVRYFNYEMNDIEISRNVIRIVKEKNLEAEFDVVATTKDKVFVVETKFTINQKYVKLFLKRKEQFFDFFPELTGKEIILIMADLSIDPNTVNLLTKNNIYAMAYREWEYMDLLNFDKIKQQGS